MTPVPQLSTARAPSWGGGHHIVKALKGVVALVLLYIPGLSAQEATPNRSYVPLETDPFGPASLSLFPNTTTPDELRVAQQTGRASNTSLLQDEWEVRGEYFEHHPEGPLPDALQGVPVSSSKEAAALSYLFSADHHLRIAEDQTQEELDRMLANEYVKRLSAQALQLLESIPEEALSLQEQMRRLELILTADSLHVGTRNTFNRFASPNAGLDVKKSKKILLKLISLNTQYMEGMPKGPEKFQALLNQANFYSRLLEINPKDPKRRIFFQRARDCLNKAEKEYPREWESLSEKPQRPRWNQI